MDFPSKAREMGQRFKEAAQRRWEALPDSEKRLRIRKQLTAGKLRRLNELLQGRGQVPESYHAQAWFGTLVFPPSIGQNVDGFEVDRLRALYEPHRGAAVAALAAGGPRRGREEMEDLDKGILELQAEMQRNEARLPDLTREEHLPEAEAFFGLGTGAAYEAKPGQEEAYLKLHERQRDLIARHDVLWMRHGISLNVLKRVELGLPRDFEALYGFLTPTEAELSAAYDAHGVPLPPPEDPPEDLPGPPLDTHERGLWEVRAGECHWEGSITELAYVLLQLPWEGGEWQHRGRVDRYQSRFVLPGRNKWSSVRSMMSKVERGERLQDPDRRTVLDKHATRIAGALHLEQERTG